MNDGVLQLFVREVDRQAQFGLRAVAELRHALTNAVGAGSTDVHCTEELLAIGDVMLLTTDGVHGALTDGQMAELLRGTDVAAAAANIVNAALAAGSRDDCTAVVAQYTNR